jgi:hypothetical protein
MYKDDFDTFNLIQNAERAYVNFKNLLMGMTFTYFAYFLTTTNARRPES